MIMSKICRTIPLKLLQYYKNACVPRNFRVIYFYLVFYSLIHHFTSSQPLLREPQCSLPLYTESDNSGESGDLITGNRLERRILNWVVDSNFEYFFKKNFFGRVFQIFESFCCDIKAIPR